jgi:hypothetical protein
VAVSAPVYIAADVASVVVVIVKVFSEALEIRWSPLSSDAGIPPTAEDISENKT